MLISDQHPTGKHPTYGRASQHINSTLLKKYIFTHEYLCEESRWLWLGAVCTWVHILVSNPFTYICENTESANEKRPNLSPVARINCSHCTFQKTMDVLLLYASHQHFCNTCLCSFRLTSCGVAVRKPLQSTNEPARFSLFAALKVDIFQLGRVDR